MKYYKFICSNGFCGCDRTYYRAVENDSDIDNIADDILYDSYDYAEPDSRFIDYETDEEYDSAYDEYRQNNLCVDWEEISKEEFERNNLTK